VASLGRCLLTPSRMAAVALAAAALSLAMPPLAEATLPSGAPGRITYQLDGDIWIMGSGGAGETPLADEPSNYESLPAFAPNGSRILFFRNDPQRDLWTMRPDGTDQRVLTDTPNTQTEFSGIYFPDGRRILFSREEGSDFDLWLMNAGGSNRHPVRTTSDVSEYANDVSPDGRRLTYAVRPSAGCCQDFDLWAINPDGSNPLQLTDTPAPVREEYSAFSPNGRRIVFDRCDNFDCDIWLMNRNGSGETPLLEDPSDSDIQPVFAANGKRIILMQFG
jgi:Tol biopolymer transport system component